MSDPVASTMAEACERFLATLSEDDRRRATFPFADDERFVWHYTPIERRGVPLGDLDEASLRATDALLRAPLSEDGADTARAIIDHEETLGRLEEEAGATFFTRDPGLYFVSVFGDPTDDPWGWRLDGHHLSLHFTVVDGELTRPTPSFFGANPARVPSGPEAGLRILAPLEDLGRELYRSLGDGRREAALVDAEAPADILTTNRPVVDPPEPEGLAGADMVADELGRFEGLVRAYADRLREDLWEAALDRIGDVRGLHFAWAGSDRPGKPHYYRIAGDDLLIEYDNTQDGANHIHTVWRDASGDFGRDLLAEHHRTHHAG